MQLWTDHPPEHHHNRRKVGCSCTAGSQTRLCTHTILGSTSVRDRTDFILHSGSRRSWALYAVVVQAGARGSVHPQAAVAPAARQSCRTLPGSIGLGAAMRVAEP